MKVVVVVVAEKSEDVRLAVDTAWSSRPLGLPVFVIAPKDAPKWPLPDGASWVEAKKTVAAATATLIPAEGGILVLQAGESLVADDWDSVRDKLGSLKSGTPVLIDTANGWEQRLLVARRMQIPEHLPGLRTEIALPTTPPPSPAATAVQIFESTFEGPKAVEVAALAVPVMDAKLFTAASQGEQDAQELVAELCRIDSDRALLQQVRSGRVAAVSAEKNPLVTVRIATYNRGPMVAERSIRTALQQTYENIEVVVVGDNCDAATEEAVRSVSDPRVRFVNLPHRGLYPAVAEKRWLVAGAHPMNAGMLLARGEWLAPCDDDDEFTDDHVEVLLRAAQEGQFEMVYSKSRLENPDGSWRMVGGRVLREGGVCHGSVLFSTDLRFIQHSMTCHRMDRPADFVMWRRMSWAGVRIGYVDHETFKHYAEGREIVR